MKNLPDKIKNIPTSPGVYIFRDKNGGILYIGKATNLRERVKSYFKNNLENRPVVFAINQIADIETKKTDSVLEALILEANLIKKIQPKYNVKEKDDKSFSYVVITKEDFPGIFILRGTELRAISYKLEANYGPYTSKKSLEVTLKIMRKIFPFHSGKQKSEKGCLEYQIGLCPGPYAGEISKKDYQKNIRGIKMILEGKKKSLLKKMEKEMQSYSKKQEFEKAGEVRNKIFALKHIQDVALISGDHLSSIPTSPLPPHPNPLLRQERGKLEKTFRIEVYDISNISGEYATGSMVVFSARGGSAFGGENWQPNKSEYRKFRIKTIQGANDVGMMKEVLLRRFQNNWPKPELILLDGGKGHLNMGLAVLKGLSLEIPIVAVAKGKERKKQDIKSRENIENIVDKKTLKQIMDEAHRFAISYHRKLRGKIRTL